MTAMSTRGLPLQQHPQFAACLTDQGREAVYSEHGLSLVRRFGPVSVSLVSRGSELALQETKDIAVIQLFTPDSPSRAAMRASGFIKLASPRTIAEWDISRPVQLLHRDLKKSWRAQLRKGCPLVHITSGRMPARGDHWLLQAEERQSEARGYQSIPTWVAQVWARLHPSKTLFLEAKRKGQPIAGMLFLIHGSVATYHISHTTEAGRNAEAHRMMLWQAMEKLKARGVRTIDLGTVDHDTSEGLARFKLGTGATERELGGTWIAVKGLKPLVAYFNRQFPSGQKA